MITNGQPADCAHHCGAGESPMVSLRLSPDAVIHRELRRLRARDVIAGVPWRTVRCVRGQSHFPGYYWSATAGRHVIYESRLELARLLVADFARDVVGIAAQPFRLQTRLEGRVRRHVPDFLLLHADGSVQVVNVKPAERLACSGVAEALRWPGRLISEHGWGYEVWTGDDPVYLANVRFLAGYRRASLVEEDVLNIVLVAVAPGDTVTALACRVERKVPRGTAKVAILRLLWQQRLITDLRHGWLDGDSVLRVAS